MFPDLASSQAAPGSLVAASSEAATKRPGGRGYPDLASLEWPPNEVTCRRSENRANTGLDLSLAEPDDYLEIVEEFTGWRSLDQNVALYRNVVCK